MAEGKKREAQAGLALRRLVDLKEVLCGAKDWPPESSKRRVWTVKRTSWPRRCHGNLDQLHSLIALGPCEAQRVQPFMAVRGSSVLVHHMGSEELFPADDLTGQLCQVYEIFHHILSYFAQRGQAEAASTACSPSAALRLCRNITGEAFTVALAAPGRRSACAS